MKKWISILLVSLVTATATAATFWPPTTLPATVDYGPDNSVELGLKFRSDVAGTVTGVRFYKSPANTGTHVGNLWTSTGLKLSTATFTGETASGWQQVNFATPVVIAANMVYVVSYHSNTGHWSVNWNFFSAALDTPPLHALVGAGVYQYGTGSVFPNKMWNSANYWVDVVFQPTVVVPPIPVPALTLGNTSEGTQTDMLGGWINAGRFQATGSLTATTVYAKVTAITGKYKVAIYADVAGRPGGSVLAGSAEVTNPAAGWQSFSLTAPVTITSGQFYWLAIWSNAGTARVYYTPGAGNLRWGNLAYGNWPNPVVTTGGAGINYSIYAAGSAVVPPTVVLNSVGVTPVNPVIALGATQQFTATGTYSDGSSKNITSQAAWTSSNAGVATIPASGLAASLSAGTVILTASLAGKSGSTALTVQSVPVAGEVRLAWDPSSGANIDHYQIYQSEEGGIFSAVKGPPVRGTTTTVTGLKALKNYRFYAVAVDAWGIESSPSNLAAFSVPAN